MALPVVAIVGRPNVGKSALFNKIAGSRLSIVEDSPGVTRDRIYAKCEWSGRHFQLIDTGGIELRTDDIIFAQMKQQAQLAIDSADVILMLTDLITGLTAQDVDVFTMLKKCGKPVILVVNKSDSPGNLPPEFYEFYNLGAGEPLAISATHGLGVGDLLDKIFEYLPPFIDEEERDEIKVAIIGRPNTGKSSLINTLLKEERLIVSDIAGTTRDAVDSPFELGGQKFILIDTAGLRRKSRIDDNIEKYSVLRSMLAVERSDVCVIMLDATREISEQDTKVAGLAIDQGKGLVIAVNKWDALEKDTKTMGLFKRNIEEAFPFMSYTPIVFISAKTGQRLDNLIELIVSSAVQNAMRIPTGKLNEVLADATSRVQPPTDKGRRLKIYYMTQPSTKPPTFVVFVNRKELFHFSYQRYIENTLRSVFGMEGTPIRFIIREKDRDDF